MPGVQERVMMGENREILPGLLSLPVSLSCLAYSGSWGRLGGGKWPQDVWPYWHWFLVGSGRCPHGNGALDGRG